MSKELRDIVGALDAGAAGGVIATVVRTEGSTYRRAGARMLLLPDGRTLGCVSGGCLEADVAVRAEAVRATGEPRLVTYDTTSPDDLVWGLGLGCNGVVDLLLEPAEPGGAAHVALRETAAREPAPHLALFGAGPDALPVVGFAALLGWRVTVADARPAFARPERFPEADRVLSARPEEAVERSGVGAGSACVVMTHNYAHDLEIVGRLLASEARYVGLLGPRRRRDMLLAELGVEAVPERLHGPVGLDLGAETPEEIALAIVAEVQSVLSGVSREMSSLRTARRAL